MINNPYKIGSVIEDEASFVGRKKTIKSILDTLKKKHILVYGERRIGKTSILKQIKSEYSQENSQCLPISLDLQMIDPDVNYFALTLARLFQKGSNADNTVIDLGNNPSKYFLSRWLPEFLSKIGKLGKQRVVLLLDEFDSIDSSNQKASLSEFYNFLKRLMRNKKVRILAVLGREPSELSAPAKKLLGRQTKIRISLMSKDEIDEIIDLSRTHLDWTIEAREKVWGLSNGQPLIAQLLCYKVFEEKLFDVEQGFQPKIFTEDINAAYPIQELGNIIQYSWSRLTPQEKVVVCFLSTSDKATDTQDVIRFIEDRGIISFYNASPLLLIFKNLRDQQWLYQKGNQVEIRILIYKLWLQKNFDLEVLIRDLFDLQAEAFQRLLESKQHDNLPERISSLEGILKLDRDNEEVQQELILKLEAIIADCFEDDNYSLANKYAIQLTTHNPVLGRRYTEKAKESMSESVLLQRIELYLQDNNFPGARKMSTKLDEIKSPKANSAINNIDYLQLRFVSIFLITNIILGTPFLISISGLNFSAPFITNLVISWYIAIFIAFFLGAAILEGNRKSILSKIATCAPYIIGSYLVYFGIKASPEWDVVRVSAIAIALLINIWITFLTSTESLTKGFFIMGINLFLGLLIVTGGITNPVIETHSTTLLDIIKNPPDNSEYIWKIMNDVAKFISTR